MATIANLALPSALIILFPIIQSARKGTETIMGENTGFIMGPFAPKQ
jgi:hypothetical protein